MEDDSYLVQFLLLRVPLPVPPPEDGWCGGQVAGVVLIIGGLVSPVVVLLHLDGPHLAMQRQGSHSQTLVLLLAIKIIEIPAATMTINIRQ